MPTTLQRLARWSGGLTLDALPPTVHERVVLQHVGAAGLLRSLHALEAGRDTTRFVGARGAARKVGGGACSRRDAVRMHLALAGWLGWSDAVFLGQPVLGGTVAAWAWARGRSVGDLLRATAAANEVGGRIGASLLLGPQAGGASPIATAAGVATAVGLLEGLGEDALASAIGLAVANAGQGSRRVLLGGGAARAALWAQAGATGVDAVELAKGGVSCPADLLDDPAGPLAAACWLPLRHAFTGLGEAWLTDTLAFRLDPVHPFAQTPVQAVQEILRRHVKAADKRLRADQVQAVEVHTGAPGWFLEQHMDALPGRRPEQILGSIRRSIGLAVAAHDLSPAALTGEALARWDERIAEVAGRVEVRFDVGRSLELAEHAVQTAAPLLSGLTLGELREVGRKARAWHGFGPPRPGPLGLLALLRGRPDALLERLAYAPHDLAAARLDEWQERMDVEVRLHTTRGGTWPERRVLPEGSPGWPWAQTVERVVARFAGDDPERSAKAASLRAADAGTGAEEWVAGLLG